LFERAEELGITKIALGHHLDDIVETTLINLCYRGSFTTMMPVQYFFDGKISIIRPMCEVYENEIGRLVTRLKLPVYEIECPYKNTNIRSKIKPILRQLQHLDKHAKEHIYSAHFKIHGEYSDFSSLTESK